MAKVASFDSETTDLIKDWKKPSDGPDQPHMMSLACILFDDQTGEEEDTLDVIIRPDGWVSTQEAFDVHGITHDHAMAVGIPEVEALGLFHAMYLRAALRTAFNTTFDNRMIRIAQKRYWTTNDEDPRLKQWKEDKERYYCTMMNARKAIGGKQPTLTEAVLTLLGRDHAGAHRAHPDMIACRDLYFALTKRETA